MKTPRRIRRKKGFLLVAMIVALALSAIVASFISLSTTVVKTTEANFSYQAMEYPGEEGLDRAFAALTTYTEIGRGGNDTLQNANQAAAMAKLEAAGWTVSAGSTTTPLAFAGSLNSGRPIALGNGRTAKQVRVAVRNVPRGDSLNANLIKPEILVEVTYAPGDIFAGVSYTRQFYLQITWPSSNPGAMVARNLLTLNGKVSVDSYGGSTNTKGTLPIGNPGPTTLNSRDNAYVACTEAAIGVDGGTALIYGYVATEKGSTSDISFKGSAHLWGDYNDVSGSENLVKDFYEGMDSKLVDSGVDIRRKISGYSLPLGIGENLLYERNAQEPGELAPILDVPVTTSGPVVDTATGKKTLTLNGGTAGGYYIVTDTKNGLTVGSGSDVERLVINGRVKIIAAEPAAVTALLGTTGKLLNSSTPADSLPPILIKAGGEIMISENSTLDVYSAGNIDTSGGSVLNAASAVNDPTNSEANASAFTIYGTNSNSGAASKVGAQTITLGGASSNVVSIRAPNANVTMSGTSGVMAGAVLAYNITTNGSIAFHYDERLSGLARFEPKLAGWIELKGAEKKNFDSFSPVSVPLN
jgi:hypothetical protein